MGFWIFDQNYTFVNFLISSRSNDDKTRVGDLMTF